MKLDQKDKILLLISNMCFAILLFMFTVYGFDPAVIILCIIWAIGFGFLLYYVGKKLSYEIMYWISYNEFEKMLGEKQKESLNLNDFREILIKIRNIPKK